MLEWSVQSPYTGGGHGELGEIATQANMGAEKGGLARWYASRVQIPPACKA